MGARFVSANALTEIELGPLEQFVGDWESDTIIIDKKPAAAGWNVISVPGEGGFVFEVIPYKEELHFSTVAVQAGNRGPFINGKHFDQEIFGLFYEQQIKSLCDTDFCNKRGFAKDTVIHAETGLMLYVTNLNGGYNIARLGTIPHGNAVLALGKSSTQSNIPTGFFPPISSFATNLDGSAPAILGYDQQMKNIQFPVFPQANPNAFLKTTLDSIFGNGLVPNMTTLDMSTNHPDATGGILNIPFIQTNVTATKMNATFWLINRSKNKADDLLQYSQTINLVFPSSGTATPIIWPHITVNTLKRKPVVQAKTQAVSNMAQTHGGSDSVPQL